MTNISSDDVLSVAVASSVADMWLGIVEPAVLQLQNAINTLDAALDRANEVHASQAEHEMIPEDTLVVDAGQTVNEMLSSFTEAVTVWADRGAAVAAAAKDLI